MSILHKKLKDLTKEDRKNHTRHIGTADFPFPMKKVVTVRNDDGSTIETEVLGVIDDPENGLSLLSDLPQEKITGIAFREMPAPSHLIYASEMIQNAHPDGERRIIYSKGTRGGGKTYKFEWLGRLMSETGTDVINCGNADLSNLIFETVIDSGGNSIFDILDRKIKNKQINPVTLNALKELVGEESINSEGVNWKKAAENARNNEDKNLALKIHELAQTEEFGSGGNALGLSQKKGRMVLNLEQGRPTLLDEYPRHKEGSDAGFHRLFEFVAGLIPDYMERSSLAEKNDMAGSVVDLKDEDRRVGSIVMLSGNTEEDGDDVHELPESVYSRVDVKYFPDLAVEDWQHRWGQFLTGAPLSTHYYAQEEKWKKDPESFVKYFKAGLTSGLSDAEIEAIPEAYYERIENFEDTLEATRILAEFCHGWADMLSKASTGLAFNEIMMEVDEVFKAERSLDPRKIKRFDDLSKRIAPKIRLEENIADKVVESELLENTSAGRLVKNMMDFAFSTTKKIGKDKTYNLLKQLVEQKDLMKVVDLLEKNPYISMNKRTQKRSLRDLICDRFVEKSETKVALNYDELMDVTSANAAFIKELEPSEYSSDSFENEELNDVEAAEKKSIEPSIVLLNDENNAEEIIEKPFRRAYSVDTALLNKNNEVQLDVSHFGSSVSYESLMRSLVLIQMRDINLNNLWDISLSETKTYTNDNVDPPALSFAQNADSANLSVTTLQLKKEFNDSATVVHVLKNNETKSILIIGDKLPENISTAFKQARLLHADTSQKHAASKIDKAISRLVNSDDEAVLKTLKSAFLLRNKVEGLSEDDIEGASLGDMITSKKLNTFLPRYILNEAQPK